MDIKMKNYKKCPVADICGGCQYQGLSYSQQLKLKQQKVEKLLGSFCCVDEIIGANNPYNYRNKSQVSFQKDYKGNIFMGNYVESTHKIVDVKDCQITSLIANKIFNTIKALAKSYKLSIFNEHSKEGFLRHVLVRNSFDNEEVMAVLVTGTIAFPKKKSFLESLLNQCPEITTIVQSINNSHTSMILGKKNIVLYGPGYIEDELCGLTFKLSCSSFYQINHAQTEKLYRKAIELAGLKGDEVVLDAYCGIGTIGLTMANNAKEVIGVEINKQAIHDAIKNAKINQIKNISFYCDDASSFMARQAIDKKHYDVVMMDPPRSGATEKFLKNLVKLNPMRVVYISCNPNTQKGDLKYLTNKGYCVKRIVPLDMFPFTNHIETVCLLTHS